MTKLNVIPSARCLIKKNLEPKWKSKFWVVSKKIINFNEIVQFDIFVIPKYDI